MKITVIGAGYVGATTAVVLASLQHQVIGADIDELKVEKLAKGQLPIVEPGLDQLLNEMLLTGKLQFTSDIKHAIQSSQVIYIAVGTPQNQYGNADLSFLKAVAQTIAESITEYKAIVIKSTVPIGTNRWLSDYLREQLGSSAMFDVISNPEFLREGSALYDTLHPDRTVVGGNSQRALEMMQEIYKTVDTKYLLTNWETAELTKYASNSFLATKISFINEMARIADKSGADITKVAEGIGMDSRIGNQFLRSGIGYGGSCFPKDVRALIHTAKELGASAEILHAVENINRTQADYYLRKLEETLAGAVTQPWAIAVLGLTFKANTDDQRESPAIKVVRELLPHAGEIRIVDPTVQSVEQTPWLHEPKIKVCKTIYETLAGTDAAVLCTDWDIFATIQWTEAASVMRTPILVDGRNLYDPQLIRQAGFHYVAVGRGQ